MADLMLKDSMRANGLGPRQERQVELDATILDQCSNRAKEGEHSVADLRRHKRYSYREVVAAQQPSLIIYLHPTHFRFDQQDGSFSYSSPMKFIFEHLKSQTVPHDMIEEL